MGHSPPSSSGHENFSANNTGVGHHLLLQGIFLTQGSNPSLLHLLALADRFFTNSSTWGIPGTEEPCGLPSIGSHRVRHDWSDLAAAAACQTLWPHGLRMPGFPVHHQLPELTQTHVHRISDAMQRSHPLLFLSPPAFNLSQHQGLSQWVSSLHQGAKVLDFQLQYVLPVNIHGWFPLGLTGWVSLLQRVSQESFPTPQFKSINSLALSSLYSPTLTSIYDYWKNHSFDYMDLCCWSNVSAF